MMSMLIAGFRIVVEQLDEGESQLTIFNALTKDNLAEIQLTTENVCSIRVQNDTITLFDRELNDIRRKE